MIDALLQLPLCSFVSPPAIRESQGYFFPELGHCEAMPLTFLGKRSCCPSSAISISCIWSTPRRIPPAINMTFCTTMQLSVFSKTSYCICLTSVEMIGPAIPLQDAALQLSSGEYWELTPERRVALLRCLTNLALSAEPVRDLFQAQAESLQLIQKAKPPKVSLPRVSTSIQTRYC